MRLLVFLALLASHAAAQTPGPPPETVGLVDRYLRAIGVGTLGTVADAVRARLYADDRPVPMLQWVSFVEGPLFRRVVGSQPAGGATHPDLVGRLADGIRASETSRDALRRQAENRVWTETTGRPPSERPGPSRGDARARVDRAVEDEWRQAGEDAVRQAEAALTGLSATDARALVAFYESGAARYRGHVVSEAAADLEADRLEAEATAASEEAPVAAVYGPVPSPPSVPRPNAPVSRAVPSDDEVYELADVQPELIGGFPALYAFVEYPEFARRAGIEGQVVVQFVVDEAGAVTDAVALRSPNELLSEAALEAVRAVRFTPGRLADGRPVKVRFAIPITFRLN